MMPVTTALTPAAEPARDEVRGPGPRDAGIADVLAFAAEQLRDLAPTRFRMISVPAPLTEPEHFLAAAEGTDAFLWEPPADVAVAGVGAAARIDLRGASRFETLRAGSERLWPVLEASLHPACDGLRSALEPPRLFGGLSFAVGAANGAPWNAFGDGSFVLPRWRYTRSAEVASLSLTVSGREVAAGPTPWVAGLERLLVRLAAPGRRGDPMAARPAVRDVERPPLEPWREQVEAIRAAIRDGRFEKVVAAHRFVVGLEGPIEILGVVARLADGLRASTRFLFARGDAVFLGATPERLVARRGRRIETEALAGSIARGAEHAERLLASGKDRREHQLVVEPIVRRLQPVCEALEVAGSPRIRTLRDVLHLHTPISGRLKGHADGGPRDILDLVEMLHPTPAVGGVPTEDSLVWIAEHEAVGRGWYAGPIGWFDAAGDGEFAVALRAAVVEGRRAHLYAGAGIVADSDPRQEYVETELKARSLLEALGVEP